MSPTTRSPTKKAASSPAKKMGAKKVSPKNAKAASDNSSIMLVFVYGTLKRGGALHQHMKGARFIGEDVVAKCDLFMLEWFPGVVRGSSQVHGEVYEIDDKILELLDYVEDEGTLTKRELVTTASNRQVCMYFFIDSLQDATRIESGNFDVTASSPSLHP